MIRRIAQTLAALCLSLVAAGLVHADMRLNLQTPETVIARDIYELHTIILIICVVIFIGVFGTMFYSVWKHRKSVGHKAEHFHKNTTIEIV